MKRDFQIDEYKELLRLEQVEHRKTKIKLKAREREVHDITQSTSYKLARILARSKHVAKQGKNHAKNLNPRRVRMMTQNKRHVKQLYEAKEFVGAFKQPATADLAVVLHLFYIDMLPFFANKLKSLDAIKYDLFITIPEGRESTIGLIHKKLPRARIAIVPNCGRDVLPFMQVCEQINSFGYSKLLKLHSKKSPHRDDGQQWRDRIVDSLLPQNKETIKQIIETLDNKNTAIIGPSDEYVSLLVNFSATAHYIKNITGKIIQTSTAAELVRTADEYGFFAGTMFWARIDAIRPIIDNISIDDFEPELGQEDSTLAHALERMLNVLPELQGKDIFEVRQDGQVAQIDPHTTNIPKWSEVALEDD